MPGSHSEPCRFAGATDNDLFCDSLYSGREYQFKRSEISAVRMDDKRRNLRIVIGGFAAAGLIWGVAKQPNPGVPRAVDGLAGAALGGLAGCVVSVPASLLIPGRVVFRQRHLDQTGHSR